MSLYTGCPYSDSSLWQVTKHTLHTTSTIPPLQNNGSIQQPDTEKSNIFAGLFEEALTPNNITDPETSNSVIER